MKNFKEKICSSCKKSKLLCEFNKNKSKKDNLATECKTCCAAYNKQYRAQNKDAIVLKKKQYSEKNKEKIAEYRKQYQVENKEKIAEYRKQWREINREKIAEYEKQWREINKEKMSEYRKQYQVENKEKIAEYRKQYREKNKETINKKNRAYLQNKRANMKSVIYEIKNKTNNRIYIGCTTQLERRWREHKGSLERGRHENGLLQKDYNKYGKDAFVYSILKEHRKDIQFQDLEKEETKLILGKKQNGEKLYNISVKISSIEI
tara:strand:- start:91 stop:879 length:789 start_codon:yes stop_codon:yes gene_type:complete